MRKRKLIKNIKNLDYIKDGCFQEAVIDGERFTVENFNVTINRNLQYVWQLGESFPTVIDPCEIREPPKYPRLHDYCKCGNSREDHFHGYGKCKGNDWAVGPDGDDYPIDCECEEFRYTH